MKKLVMMMMVVLGLMAVACGDDNTSTNPGTDSGTGTDSRPSDATTDARG